jgi:basic amino acid/polyamine antiporter, APA family
MNNQENQESNKLLKLLGVGFGIAVTIGGTIGTGILRKPGPIAESLGNPTLIMLVWILVSIYAFLGVLCTIELGVSVPKAGAWYVYARRAFGDYVGFIVGLTSWLGTVAALGFGAYTMCEFVADLIPSVKNYVPYMAVVVLILLMLFHWTGVKSAGKSQEVMSFLKALGLFILVIACFVAGGGSEANAQTSEFVPKDLTAGFLAALLSVFYAYDGWHTAAYFSEESTDPVKNLPKSMISGVLLIIVIYLLVNLAILYVLPMNELVQSKLAASTAIEKLFGKSSSNFITVFLTLSIFGIVNAQIMFAPRVIYSMSRDGLFFKSMQTVNKGGTPSFAMLLTGFCSIILILIGKDTCEKLSDVAVIFFVLSYAAGFASVLMLRKREPELPRPYKVIGYPFVPILLLICSFIFLGLAIYKDINDYFIKVANHDESAYMISLYALIFLGISYPLYWMVKQLNG